MGEWWYSSTPRVFYCRGKRTTYPLDRRLDVPQSRSGCGGEEKIFLYCPFRDWNPGRPAGSLMTILAELQKNVEENRET
jgi:hypothetical protein